MTVRSKTIWIIALVLAIAVCGTVFAAILFSFKVDGNVDGDTGDVSKTVSVEVSDVELNFANPGDNVDVPVTVSNAGKANVVYSFGINATQNNQTTLTAEQQNRLKSAILVYQNGKFVGTLAELTADGEGKLFGGYIMYGNGNKRTQTEKFTFELHIAADSDAVGKQFDLQITTYVSNADYSEYIFVSDGDELAKAADDVNGGLLDSDKTQTIVLSADVSLDKAIAFSAPVNIDLHGNALTLNQNVTLGGSGLYRLYSSKAVKASASGTGKIVLDSANAALNVEQIQTESGTDVSLSYSDLVQVENFDADTALQLLVDRLQSSIGGGIASQTSVSVFGALDFYKNEVDVTVDGSCVYSGGTLTASTVTATEVGTITFSSGSFIHQGEFRIVASGDGAVFADLLNNELKHIPDSLVGDAVTYDVFLPKAVQSKNVRIEWTSSAPESMSDEGKLAEVLTENTPVTLFAKVYVNDSVFTTSFSFRVTSQTRETKFKYLVAQLSPLRLTTIYDATNDNKNNAYFYLPVVGGEHDYRGNFTMYGDSVTWTAFNDIGLKSLTYAVKSAYNFVSLDGKEQAVYLNSATFFTFAQMTVTGDFGDGETYTENVNILIELGNNSELYELVFGYVEKTFNDVDILQNILDTRSRYGVKYESGNFLLPKQYHGIDISYTAAHSAITSIDFDNATDMYVVHVNPEQFSLAESNLGINVSVVKSGDTGGGQKRILYVTAPAVIRPDDNGFANYSVFSATKYQVVCAMDYTVSDGLEGRLDKLPDVTVSAEDKSLTVKERSGFSVSGKSVTNSTPDYILQYDTANVKKLTYNVGNDGTASNSHDKAYNLARLLQWATGNTEQALPFAFGTYTTETKSDDNEYLNEKETEVVKTYLTSEVGFTAQEVSELWASATTTPQGRLIGDYSKITEVVANYCASASDKMLYFKYTEVLQWALNEKDFDNTSAGVGKGCAPNMSTIGGVNVTMDGTSSTSTSLNWNSDPSTWTASAVSSWSLSKYNSSTDYSEDFTEYISDAEAQVIMAFWFALSSNNSYQLGKNFATAFLAACVQPTFLHEDGAGKLVNAVYNKLRQNEGGFTVYLADDDTSETGVPQVSVLDYSTTAVAYFSNLTVIKVHGEVSGNAVVTSAFVTSGSVNGFFNRITKLDADRTDVKFDGVGMRACANGNATLDLTNISRLSAVTQLDFSYNSGITSIGDILNVDIKKLNYLDVHKVGVRDKYRNYVLDNIAANNKSAKLWCSNQYNLHDEYNPVQTTTSDELRFLAELTKVNSPYLALATKLNSGKGDKTVQWYVNKGNPAYLVDDVGIDDFSTVTSVDQMNALLSNFYACTESVAEYGLQAGKVYRIAYKLNGTSGHSIEFIEVGTFDQAVTAVPDTADLSGIDGTKQASTVAQGDAVGEEPDTYTTADGFTKATLEATFGEKNVVKLENKTLNDYLDFPKHSSSQAWIYAAAVYEVTVAKDFVTTYRCYVGSGAQTEKTYFVNSSVVKATYSRFDSLGYFEFSVTETRQYKMYFYQPRNSTGVLDQIYTGTRTSTNTSDSSSVNFDSFDSFTYGSDDIICTYRENGHMPYTVSNYSATVGGQTLNDTDFDSLKSKIENHVLNNYQSNEAFVSEVVQGSVTKTESEWWTYAANIGTKTDCEQAVQKINNAVNGTVLYKYTGVTGSKDYYEGGTLVSGVTFTNGNGYRLTSSTQAATSTNVSKYSFADYDLHDTASAINLKDILAEANLHKDDALFGNYYGNYYCYSGATRTVGETTYTQYSVYRLLFNDELNTFYFENAALASQNKQTYKPITTASDLFSELVNALSGASGALEEGSIIYYTGDKNSFYAHGFFELVYNPDTMVYYFKSMGGLGNIQLTVDSSGNGSFTESSIEGQNLSASGISKFTNVRYVGNTVYSFYGGTGGSEDVEVVARIKELNSDGTYTIYERPFYVTVSA